MRFSLAWPSNFSIINNSSDKLRVLKGKGKVFHMIIRPFPIDRNQNIAILKSKDRDGNILSKTRCTLGAVVQSMRPQTFHS